VPLGAPVWLNTTRPDHKSDQQKIFQRLMVAQDTGGAIKGVVRGDVYWGAGERATHIAGKMKNQGHYWVLLPTPALVRLQGKLA
jgi:membrane-bound lytic murein transglycosylase A